MLHKEAFLDALSWCQTELEAQLQETRREVAALTAEGKRIQVTYKINYQGGFLPDRGEEGGFPVYHVSWARIDVSFAW